MPTLINNGDSETRKESTASNAGNGGGGNGKQHARKASKSDESASFLRAARGGNSEKVLEYLKNGTDINTCNANGLNALHLSSKEGHVHIVTELLARGAKIDAATKKGNTALHIASLAGQEEVVKILVGHSASVNVQSQNGFTPLYMAAQENHDGVVRFLLASGASQSLATEDGFTPLAVALQQGHDKVVAVLLENDTRGKVRLPALHIAAKKDDTKAAALLLQNDHNPDVTSKSGFTPLHISAHYGNENIAQVLLQRGADVNYSAKHNITPLHVAAKWGKVNLVTLLLDRGANLESRTRDGLTPLHCAARSGHDNVVEMMLQRGAPISAKTKNGLAPLHMASQGDHVDAARVLLHHKAPVDEVTVDYLTALHVAAHCGHARVAKLLLDRKADPNSRALNGFTPLHIACKKNRIKVVELLLKYGASIEATTESGLTPLHVASFMGCMNIVIFLIQHQASPDEATVRGETPLHLAARANQTDIIRILLRNGAKVDAKAREEQTPLHIASRLGNVDIVVLLLQSGAKVDSVTKDLYTALHIAAKEGQDEVAGILLEHGASISAATKKGFTPLHLAAKYGNVKVAKQLLSKESTVDAVGKNGVTPLHVAVHYDNTALAMLMLERGASPHAAAKNGYTPLHISARKNQLDIARKLLEYEAKVDSESKAGFAPIHLASQEGHGDMVDLLVKANADVNIKAKNGLTPMHLCAQEDKVDVAKLLVTSGAETDAETKSGYTPLHVASHFGQLGMVRYLLSGEGGAVRVDVQNELGYTPLHQAAQQGHSQIVNLLLEAGSSPNHQSKNGQTALCIAQKLGYISVVETLKVVTDEVITTTVTTTVEEKYRVLAPESMQETFLSDSEDEGGEENTQDQSYKYLTNEEMKGLGDDSMQIDVTSDEKEKKESMNRATEASIEKKILEMERTRDLINKEAIINNDMVDNVDIPVKPPVSAGFLVSFMVDARGGAMRGCRHSGVRVIIPPRKAPMPMRVTCRYLKKDKLVHPPPLNEGEALASRILELGPAKANFLGPVIIEVPHFASLRGKEREIIILRSDDGEKWREHSLDATEEAIQEILQESFDGEDAASQLEDLNTNRITRIVTTDFPQYFAVISRIRQELHYIGPEGGLVNSSVVPQVQAMFPQGALTKKIKVGLQAQPIPPELTAKLLGNRVAVSPIVTVEPRRRKFHKPITLTIPVPVAAGKGMINQYTATDNPPTLRLLCSITGGTTRAQWEDVTGSTPLTFLNQCVSFTTTVSARFWLMDCRNVQEVTKMATTLYKEVIHVPFMAKFVVFSKRHEQLEARMRVFCMTDDKEEKTLEQQEHFHEVAKSRDVEVLEGKTHYLEFSGNLNPITKSGDQLTNRFLAFRENRLPFSLRVRDPNSEPTGRISFFKEPRQAKGEAQATPICNLNINLPADISPDHTFTDKDLLAIQAKYSFLREAGYGKYNTIQRADLRISDISNLLDKDWIKVARELDIEDQDINLIITEYPDNVGQQAMVMLRLWLNTAGNRATGNILKDALTACGRQDIIDSCALELAEVTDKEELSRAENQLGKENGFHGKANGGTATIAVEEEPIAPLTPSPTPAARYSTAAGGGATQLKRDFSMDVSYDEQDMYHKDRVEQMHQISEEEPAGAAATTTEEEPQEASTTTTTTARDSDNETKYRAEEKEVESIGEVIEEKFEEIIVERGVREESVSKEETATKEQVVEKKESIIEQSAAIISKESFTQKESVSSYESSTVQESSYQASESKFEATESKIEAFESKLEASESRVEAFESKMEASESKIESSESSYQATTEISEQLQKTSLSSYESTTRAEESVLSEQSSFVQQSTMVHEQQSTLVEESTMVQESTQQVMQDKEAESSDSEPEMLEKPSSDEYDERQDHVTAEQPLRPADSSETEDDIRPDDHMTAEQARHPADSSETEDDLRHHMPAESSETEDDIRQPCRQPAESSETEDDIGHATQGAPGGMAPTAVADSSATETDDARHQTETAESDSDSDSDSDSKPSGARGAAGTRQLLEKSSADEREAESDSEPEEKEKEEVEEIGEITTTTVEEGELVDRRGVEGLKETLTQPSEQGQQEQQEAELTSQNIVQSEGTYSPPPSPSSPCSSSRQSSPPPPPPPAADELTTTTTTSQDEEFAAAVSKQLSVTCSHSSISSGSSEQQQKQEQQSEEESEEDNGIEIVDKVEVNAFKTADVDSKNDGKEGESDVSVLDNNSGDRFDTLVTTSSFQSIEQSSLISSSSTVANTNTTSSIEATSAMMTAATTTMHKDIDDASPTEGLAAPDSKDSLEVNLTSVCEDLSDNMSGKDESLEDIKCKASSLPQEGDEDSHSEDYFDDKQEYDQKEQEGKNFNDQQQHSTDSSFEMVETTNTVEEVHFATTGGEEEECDSDLPPPPASNFESDNNKKQDVSSKDVSSSSDEEGPVEKVIAPLVRQQQLPEDFRSVHLAAPHLDELPVQDSFDSVASQYSSENVRGASEFSHSSSSDEEGPEEEVETGSDRDVHPRDYVPPMESTATALPISALVKDSFDSSSDNNQPAIKSPEASPETSVSTRQEVTEVKKQMTAGEVSSSEEECIESANLPPPVGLPPPPPSLAATSAVSVDESDDSPLPAKRLGGEILKPLPKKASSTESKSGQSSSASSDTEEEEGGKPGAGGAASSSDYDSSSAPKFKPRSGKRPDSFVSDTSSDYDSLSNLESRRPQSFVLDDEYEVITEEETGGEVTTATSSKEVEHQKKKNIDDDVSDASSESSESGPDVQAGRQIPAITTTKPTNEHADGEIDNDAVPSSNHLVDSILPSSPAMDVTSNTEEQDEQDLPDASAVDLASVAPLSPSPSLHATPPPNLTNNDSILTPTTTTCSVDIAHQSSVIHSNTLEEIDPLAPDYSHSSPLTRSSDSAASTSSPAATGEAVTTSASVAVVDSSITSSLCSTSSSSSQHQKGTDILSNSAHTQDLGTLPDVDLDLPESTQISSPISISQAETTASVTDKVSPTCKPILEQDFKKVFESISTSSVASRISEIHKDDLSASKISSSSVICEDQLASSTQPPSNIQGFEAFGEAKLEDEDQDEANEVKPIPKKRELQKINSTDLLHRQIKDTMLEQVMCEDDDSVMSESAIKAEDSEESMVVVEQHNASESSDIVKIANETFVEEPEWEMVESEMDVPDIPDSKDEDQAVGISPRNARPMSPEQALEIATEVVRQVQVQALKKYEEISAKQHALPRPTPDSKFTPETKEKVQVYLKELEESEKYDKVTAELITNIISKKEEKIQKMQDSSLDITDDLSRSEAMMSELKNELGRSSVTDEELVTDANSEFLEEANIQEMKNRLEATMSRPYQLEPVSSDFRFQASFREHYVTDAFEASNFSVEANNKDVDSVKQSAEKDDFDPSCDKQHQAAGKKESKPDIFVQEDIWAEESKHVNKDAYLKEKKSDNESLSSDSKLSHRRSGTDFEGYTSGDTLVSGDNLSHHSYSSRPTSSDVDAMLSAVSEHSSTTENTEFVTAQDKSSGDTSFFTAASTLSSSNSVISSESSGNLGSVEVSECSETLVESSLEYDGNDGNDTPNSLKHLDEILDKNPFEFDSPTGSGESQSDSKVESKMSSVEMVTSYYSEHKQSSEIHQESVSEMETLTQSKQQLGAGGISESRETLSSSVLTLSSISEATVLGPDPLMAGNSQMLTSQTVHRSFVLPKDPETGLIGTHVSVEIGNEQLALENQEEQDQVFQVPRVRSIEGAHAVQITIPQEISIDLGSEYDSRPSSELAESRPLSADKISRPATPEKEKTKFSRRAFSIDESVSDSLRVEEPFARPVSPLPQKHRIGSTDSDDGRLKVNLAPQMRAVSPGPPKLIETDESIEADIAFSKHFTQVLDDDDDSSEIIKTTEGQSVFSSNRLTDVTPESQNTSESMETSGQDFFLDQYSKDTSKARSPRLPHDIDDDLLVGSPPMVSRPLGVKYWPPVDNLDQEQDGSVPLDKRSITRSESDDNSESRLDIETSDVDKEVETSKKWLESQFEEVPDEFGNFTYSQPLDKIVEEEEEHYSITSEEMKELAKFKESLSSTPDFEAIALRRHHILKTGGDDDVSMGSLTEFERLEREVALGSGSGSRGSLGSNDSLELGQNGGNGKPTHLAVKLVTKTSQGDDVSVSSETSITSFEMMERACDEAEIIEKKAKHQEEVLSEIEEGHESQVSESETNETLSECENQSDEEYEDRIFEIDNIIKQAQENVEKFDKEGQMTKPEELSLENLMMRPESKTESVSTQDSLEEGDAADLPLDSDNQVGFRLVRPYAGLMEASADSLDSKNISSMNVMTTSADSLEPDTPRSTTDKMTMSTDSIENNRAATMTGDKSEDPMIVSVDSLDGRQMIEGITREGQSTSCTAASSLLFTSTDSLESSSNCTRATASMLSSITSQDSETFVADDEFETEDEEIRRTRKFLMSQGNIRFEDSDESTTCSHSSPQLHHHQLGGTQPDDSSMDIHHHQLASHYSDPFILTTTTMTTTSTSEEVLHTQVMDEKGNVLSEEIKKKTLTGAVSLPPGNASKEVVKEITTEIDEHGNKKVFVVEKSTEKQQ